MEIKNKPFIKCILCVLIHQIHIEQKYVLLMTENKMIKTKKNNAQSTYKLRGRLTRKSEIVK